MLAFIASLLMGFLIGFFLEATIGMIGFWFLGSQLAAVHLHAVQLLFVGSHVPADFVA